MWGFFLFSVYWYIFHMFGIYTQNEIMNSIHILFGNLRDNQQNKMLYVTSKGRIIPRDQLV